MPIVLGNLRKLELYAQQPVSRWCRTPPWPKQETALGLDVKELLFGGAAGGGKSDFLLRGALQYAHVPGYSALILRTDLQRLRLAGGLIPRSQEWLVGKGADWNGNNFMWTFPSGATLQFGYLSSSMDKYRYGSSEYQYIAFDELTEFMEEDYLYLFSRLRKKINIDVPYRIRAASNPGGKGHDWVRQRFVTEEAMVDLKVGELKTVYYTSSSGDSRRAFIPAKIKDNPAVNPDDYIANLMHLSPVERERLMNGDWTVMPTGLIKSKWLRYYKMRNKMVDLLVSRPDREGNTIHTNEVLYEFHEDEATRFMVVDSAGGVEDIEREYSGKPLSYTACGVFSHKHFGENRALMVRHIRRARGLGYTDIRELVLSVYGDWKPYRIYVEDKALGLALVSDLQRMKIPIEAISPGNKDKVARAAPFMNMMEQGQVYLPQGENSWRPAYEAELLGWLGRKDEVNDQIDISAYAADLTGGFIGGVVKLEVDPRSQAMEIMTSGRSEGRPDYGGGIMKGWQ